MSLFLCALVNAESLYLFLSLSLQLFVLLVAFSRQQNSPRRGINRKRKRGITGSTKLFGEARRPAGRVARRGESNLTL